MTPQLVRLIHDEDPGANMYFRVADDDDIGIYDTHDVPEELWNLYLAAEVAANSAYLRLRHYIDRSSP